VPGHGKKQPPLFLLLGEEAQAFDSQCRGRLQAALQSALEVMTRLIDMAALYRDHGVPVAPMGHKHAHKGWVHTVCPFCDGDPGFHLGFNLDKGYYNCWRCGWKPVKLALALLLRLPERETGSLVRLYPLARQKDWPPEAIETPSPILTPYPLNFGPLQTPHKRYLESRKFDPEALEREWGLLATGPISWPGWKWRIIVPIQLGSKLISYQTRSISTDAFDKQKYKACPEKLEVMKHKHSLFGIDKARGDSIIVVEGVMDVFRLGPGAVATFGTQTMPSQRMLLRRFKRVFILFDIDPHGAGQEAGEKLAWQMSGFGVETKQVFLDHGDPAELGGFEAKKLMSDLGAI